MTEVPEHLLARSRARKAGGASPADAAGDTPAAPATPAPAAAATPAKAAATAPATPKPPAQAPDLPWVAAAKQRRKIPLWAGVMLVAIIPWAIIYAFTLDPQTAKELGVLEEGGVVYAKCASCHGATGGGGSGPQLSGGSVLKTFATPAEQFEWVAIGSSDWQAKTGRSDYGTTKKPLGAGGMPAWDSLTARELIGVVRHERETLQGSSAEAFDMAKWADILPVVEKHYPDRKDEFVTALEEMAKAEGATFEAP